MDDGKLIFGYMEAEEGPTLMLGVPAEAWEYMRDGKTHRLDLTKIGVPLKLILFGAKDAATALGFIKEGCEAGGIKLTDLKRV